VHAEAMKHGERTVDILARSVGKHFAETGLPPSALVDLACRLLDEARRQIASNRTAGSSPAGSDLAEPRSVGCRWT
jgi:hypothetical protein